MRLFFARLFSFFRSRRGDAELNREINAHLQLLEDNYLAQGMSVEEARFAARRAFGGQVEQTKVRHRDARSFRFLDESWLDVKLAIRMLIKYPGLTLVGGLGMAVGVAISTAFFTFLYAHMFASLPFDEGDRIVALENWDVQVNNEQRQALHDFVLWRDEMKTMEEIGAFRTVSHNLIVPGGSVEPVRLAEMTASAFRIVRIAPVLGRPLLDADEQANAPPVVVIGHDIWRSRFAADPAVVGREIRLGNVVYTIVGVMPAGFHFPVNHSYWIPFRLNPANYARGRGPAIFIFGRLAKGVTTEAAQAQLTAIGQRMAAEFPDTHANRSPRVLPYSAPVLDIQDMTLWQAAAFEATVSVVLIVVTLNIAVLVYARTASRQSEIAVRAALGASRARIVGQLFIEALVLSVLSAVVGLALTKFGIAQGREIVQLEGALPFWIDFGLRPIAIAYAVGLVIVAAVIAGVVPALRATSRKAGGTLRQLGGATGLQLGTTWTVLIVAQVALAVAGLPLAFEMAWSEARYATTQPVFDQDQFLMARIDPEFEPPEGTAADAYRRGLAVRFSTVRAELLDRLAREPWVADLTQAASTPGEERSARMEVETADRSSSVHEVTLNTVDVDFFEAFDARISIGRTFTAGDRPTAPAGEAGVRPVIVNRAFVERVLDHGNPLGTRLRYVSDAATAGENRPSYEIVGVVANLHSNLTAPQLVKPVVYHPLRAGDTAAAVVIRVSGGPPASIVGRLREMSAAVDPTMQLAARPLADAYRQGTVALRLVTLALALILVSVMLLSAAGIYALMSFTVTQRRKEIGIRAALGADAGKILRSIFARSAAQLTAGLVTGAASAWAMIDGEGAMFLPPIAALMLVVGLLASAGPARRGLRIQPIQALREE